MNRLKIIAIFPVAEDVQPGDVMLDVPPAADADARPKIQRLGSLDRDVVVGALTRAESDRLVMEGLKTPATPDKPAATPGAGPASTVSATATLQPGTTIRTQTSVTALPAAKAAAEKPAEKPAGGRGAAPGAKGSAAKDPTPVKPQVLDFASAQTEDEQKVVKPRMRRIALPGIVAARVYDWQLSGAGPIGRVAVALGLAGNGSNGMVITLRNLESLGFDELRAQTLLQDNMVAWLRKTRMTAFTLLNLTNAINPEIVQDICHGVRPADDKARAAIRIINRVTYAHDIQYEYTRTSQETGRLAADISQVAVGNAARPLVPSTTAAAAGATQAGSTTVAANSGAAIDAEMARLAALQSGLSQPSAPGVRASVGIGTYGNASLIDSFNQPMAVGFNVAASFGVRDSLVTLGNTQTEADQQLFEARQFCNPLETSPPADRVALDPVEQYVCDNTNTLIRRPGGGTLPLPRRCSGNATVQPIAPSTPFRLLPAQSRDNKARSF